jgi:hypothetical protein
LRQWNSPVPAVRRLARSPHVAQLAALDPRLQSCIAKEKKDALDNLRDFADFVGVGNGNLLHRRRADSHPVGHRFGSIGNPPASGTQGCLVHDLHASVLHQAGDWAADCYLRLLESKKNMPLVNIVIALIVVGVALWLINTFIPMASSIKTILNVVVVVAVAIWVLKAFGLWERIASYKFT